METAITACHGMQQSHCNVDWQYSYVSETKKSLWDNTTVSKISKFWKPLFLHVSFLIGENGSWLTCSYMYKAKAWPVRFPRRYFKGNGQNCLFHTAWIHHSTERLVMSLHTHLHIKKWWCLISIASSLFLAKP